MNKTLKTLFLKCIEENDEETFPVLMDREENEYTIHTAFRMLYRFKYGHCYLLEGTNYHMGMHMFIITKLTPATDYGTTSQREKNIII